MLERHRLTSGFSEGHGRIVEIATVDRNALRVEKLDQGVTPNAARGASIGDTNCHQARTGESVRIAR
jgi:hypothetical protein